MLKRFAKLHSTAWLAALCLTIVVPASAIPPTQVKTDKGTVEGDYSVDQKVIAFKGIPFAAAPVGDLRWKPPVPAAAWRGVRAAKAFGYRCPQSGSYDDMVFHDAQRRPAGQASRALHFSRQHLGQGQQACELISPHPSRDED